MEPAQFGNDLDRDISPPKQRDLFSLFQRNSARLPRLALVEQVGELWAFAALGADGHYALSGRLGLFIFFASPKESGNS